MMQPRAPIPLRSLTAAASALIDAPRSMLTPNSAAMAIAEEREDRLEDLIAKAARAVERHAGAARAIRRRWSMLHSQASLNAGVPVRDATKPAPPGDPRHGPGLDVLR
jgi:hypothetical protein